MKVFLRIEPQGQKTPIFSVFISRLISFLSYKEASRCVLLIFFYNLISNQNIYRTSPLYHRHEIVLLIIISSLSKRHIGLPRHINAIPLSPPRNYEHKYKRYPFKDWTFIHISCYFFQIFWNICWQPPHWWRLSASIYFFSFHDYGYCNF